MIPLCLGACSEDWRDVASFSSFSAITTLQRTLTVIGNAVQADLTGITHVIKSPAFMEIAQRNAQAAAKPRDKAQHLLDLVKKGTP